MTYSSSKRGYGGVGPAYIYRPIVKASFFAAQEAARASLDNPNAFHPAHIGNIAIMDRATFATALAQLQGRIPSRVLTNRVLANMPPVRTEPLTAKVADIRSIRSIGRTGSHGLVVFVDCPELEEERAAAFEEASRLSGLDLTPPQEPCQAILGTSEIVLPDIALTGAATKLGDTLTLTQVMPPIIPAEEGSYRAMAIA